MVGAHGERHPEAKKSLHCDFPTEKYELCRAEVAIWACYRGQRVTAPAGGGGGGGERGGCGRPRLPSIKSASCGLCSATPHPSNLTWGRDWRQLWGRPAPAAPRPWSFEVGSTRKCSSRPRGARSPPWGSLPWVRGLHRKAGRREPRACHPLWSCPGCQRLHQVLPPSTPSERQRQQGVRPRDLLAALCSLLLLLESSSVK